jgi:hypothetical protein
VWRYNIVSAAKPVTDLDNAQQRGPGCGTSCGVGAAPGAQHESAEVDVETWDTIRSRRNVRSYGEWAIAPEDLDRILEAARGAHPPQATSRRGTSSSAPTGSSSRSLPDWGPPPATSPGRQRRSRSWPRGPTTPGCAT